MYEQIIKHTFSLELQDLCWYEQHFHKKGIQCFYLPIILAVEKNYTWAISSSEDQKLTQLHMVKQLYLNIARTVLLFIQQNYSSNIL